MFAIRFPMCLVAGLAGLAITSSSCFAQMTSNQAVQPQIGTSQIQLAASAQQYQILLVQSNGVLTGTFAFSPTETTAEAAVGGMSGGLFAAELQGQFFIGQFMSLDFDGGSLWIAQAGNGQMNLVVRGWITPDMLTGQAAIFSTGPAQLPGANFLVIGQAMVAQPLAASQVQGTVATSPLEVPIIPTPTPDARPSPGPDARPSSIFGRP